MKILATVTYILSSCWRRQAQKWTYYVSANTVGTLLMNQLQLCLIAWLCLFSCMASRSGVVLISQSTCTLVVLISSADVLWNRITRANLPLLLIPQGIVAWNYGKRYLLTRNIVCMIYCQNREIVCYEIVVIILYYLHGAKTELFKILL